MCHIGFTQKNLFLTGNIDRADAWSKRSVGGGG